MAVKICIILLILEDIYMKYLLSVFYKIRAYIYRNDISRCSECGTVLTDTEKYYYGHTCDRCEAKFQRMLDSE